MSLETMKGLIGGLNTNQIALIITKKQLTLEQAKELLLTTTLSEEEKEQILIKAGLITSTNAQTGANVGLTASLKGVTAALWAQAKAWLATPLGMATVAVAGILLVVKAVQYFSESVDRSREKLAELKQEASDIQNELSSLNEELKTTSDRIKELESKGTLTFTEKTELDNLKAQNAELERQIALNKLKAQSANEETNKTFAETMSKDLENKLSYSADSSGRIVESNSFVMSLGTQQAYFGATEKDYIEQQFNDYKDNLDRIAKLDEQYKDDLSNEQYQADRKRYEDNNKKIREYLESKSDDFETDSEGISYISNPTSEDDKKVNAWLDYINDYNNKLLILLGDAEAKFAVFNSVITDNAFSSTIKDLKTLGEQGKVTADDINSGEYDEFIDKLISIGFISDDSDDSLNLVASAFNELAKSADDAGESIEQAEVKLSSFNDKMSKLTSLSSGFDLLDEIYADIYDKGDFDYSKIFNNEDFTEAFGEMPSYDSFMETIASSPDNLAACQNAFDQLTQEYIEHSHVLDNLTDAERDAAVAYLEQMGFANAAAIVDNKIAVAKEKKRIQTKLGAEATLDEILMMIDEEEQSYDTMRALVELAIAKLDVNRNAINLSSDINQIIDLAEKAGATTESLKNLAKAKALVMEAERYEDLMKTTADPRGKATLAHWADDLYAQAEAIKNEPIEYKLAEYKYSGGSKYNSAVDKAVKDAEKEAEKNEPQKYDWIEKSISRIERVINKLKNTANSTYKSLKTRLGATANQITEVNKLLKIQQQAYNRYMEEANAVGLSPELAEKVRNGTIDITEYDEDTKELIEDYAQWYEKALECSDAIDELHESLASLYEDNFDNIKSNFENQLELAEYLTNSYENGIDMLEAKGYLESTKYYAAMQTAQKQNIATLTAELVGLEAAFAQAMASGEIEAYSESWYNMRNAINGVKSEIQAANVELMQYEKTMREIEWSHFDYTQDRITQLTQEADFLIDLMSYSDLLNDKGKLTDKGMATAGLHGQNYNVYMAQADMYANEIASLDREMARDPFNADLIARREELLGLQQEAIIAAEEEKQAIVDLVEEGINLELESLKELIDTYTESLDSAKDLYEYQKKVKEQTETIASIQKQLSAYENDTSEETKAKVQQLKVDLSEAQEDLAETEYERYISDTKKLLDELYLDFETTLNQRLDNVDALIGEMIDSVNFNSDSINSTLISVTNSVGYTMTDQMSSIWENAENVISQYGDEISTSIDSVISAIQANTAAMVAASNAEAIKTVVSTAASTVTTPSAVGSVLTAVGSAINSMTNTGSGDSQKKDTSAKTISKGSKINAQGAPIYDYVGDTSGETQVFGNDPYYTVLDEQDGYLKVRWHKLSSGVTGWFKKSDVKAYKTGGLVDYTGLAQLDGTPQKPEIVLNPEDSQNFLALRDTLREMAKTDLGINSYNVAAPQLTGLTNIADRVAELRNNTISQNNDISFGDINIDIDHVENYDDFVTKLRDDKKFEQMMSSAILGKISGKSSLDKYKYNWT